MINKDMMQDVYSTEEIKTNKVWIDGKPIYRKVINIGNVSKSEVQTSVNVSNLNKVIHISGGGYMSNGNYLEWSFSNINGFVSCYFQAANNKLISYAQYELFNSFAIIEYTKTTD